MTGSARLTADIHRLDLFAFETNRRKLQLSQTFSLAEVCPFEFERFRETGVLALALPLELFDAEFPGQYLRLIKRVSVSIVALVPPVRGIRATLAASGLSREVVNAGGVFQAVGIRRDPELIAFTSPRDAIGLFEGQLEGEMLLPFEGSGVDTLWTLELPRAANTFDARTLADVFLTIQYTVLHSADYRREVIQRLSGTLTGERSFSFREEFADAFYELSNPGRSTPLTVRFRTGREDFPRNLEALRILHVLLYFSRAVTVSLEIVVEHLHFKEQGSADDAPPLGGGATSLEGVISTRRGKGAASRSRCRG